MRTTTDNPAELADWIEARLRSGFYKPGDVLSSSGRASLGDLIASHLPLVLAALRAAPVPGMEAEGRDAQQLGAKPDSPSAESGAP